MEIAVGITSSLCFLHNIGNSGKSQNDPLIDCYHKEKSIWNRFYDCCHFKTKLEKSILDLPNKISKKGFNDHHADTLLSALKNANGNEFSFLQKHLRTIVKQLQIENTTMLFRKFACHEVGDPQKERAERFLSLWSLEELKGVVNNVFPGVDCTIFEKLDGLCKEGKPLEGAAKSRFLQVSQYVLKLIHALFDTLAMALSFFELGKDPGGSWEASHLITVYGKLLAIPVSIFLAVQTLINPITAVGITALVVLGLIGASYAYFNWWHPCPEDINNCENLSARAASGKIEVVHGREPELEKIIDSLQASNAYVRQHPLVIGSPSVGKTSLGDLLAQRIFEGKVPSSLKKMKVFKANTSKLLPSQFEQLTSKLDRLLKKIEPHQNEIILILDEIAVAFDPAYRATVGTWLLSVLDKNIHIIGMTTTEEYKKFIEVHPVDMRFRKIEVKSTDEEQTLTILRSMIADKAADFGITDDLLKHLYQKTNGKEGFMHPAIDKRILAAAMTKLENYECSETLKEALQKKKQEYDSLLSKYKFESASKVVGEGKSYLDKLNDLKDQIGNYEKQILVEKRQIEELLQLRDKRRSYHSEAQKIVPQIGKNEKASKKYFFLNTFLKAQVNMEIDALEAELSKTKSMKLSEQMLNDLIDNWKVKAS